MTIKTQKAIAPQSCGGGDRHIETSVLSPSHFNPASKQYQRSGQNHPCPICGRTKDADCCWNDEVVFCHTYVDTDAKVSGYVYRGTKDIWGMYFPEGSKYTKPPRPKSKQEYLYTDVDGSKLVKVHRTDDGKGKKRIWQSHWDGKQWVKGLNPEVKSKLRLYRIADPINQEAIANQKPILIVEGEGKVDLLLIMKVAATCAIGGAGKWKHYGYPNYKEDLAGAKVVLCPDRDIPGVQHCLEIEQDFPEAQWLYAFPDPPLWEYLPKSDGLDIKDWVLQDSLSSSQILSAIEPKRSLPIPTAKATKSTNASEHDDDLEEGAEDSERKTIAQLLLEIAAEGDYFHTPSQKAYVDIQMDGVRQTFPVRHKLFKMWLRQELYQQHEKTAGSETLNQVLGILEAQACFDGEERETHLRIAEHKGKVYIDLGTADWTAVEVSITGWQIVSDYPVRFRRPDTVLPLPMPCKDGQIAQLRQMLNMDEEAWTLAVTWLLFSFYPTFPHPILVLHGEQGTGKSYTAGLLKGLIDPGKAPLIPHVADLRNLAIAAENRWVLAYDNLSHLSAEQSDALCRISTGGGFSTRTLYENDEETVFEFIRPQILTGIDSLASRGDLMERSLMVRLTKIPEDERQTEAQLNQQFEQVKGPIFGALLTALSQTLKALPLVNPERLPRMADFAKFAIAAEPALGLPPGSFLQVYASNREEAHETAVQSSPVAMAVQRLMQSRSQWRGTATELLEALSELVDEKTLKSKYWAGTPRSLGKQLIRLAPDLRGIGIEVVQDRTSSNRLWLIDRVDKQTSQTSLTSQPNSHKGLNDDNSRSLNVTQMDSNVMDSEGLSDDDDVTALLDWQTSSDVMANVMAESVDAQGLQPMNDKSDVCDVKLAALSTEQWVHCKSLDTQVRVIALQGQSVRVHVPGIGERTMDRSDLELLNNIA